MSASAPASGVQILLDAEKEANRIVASARQYRVERIRAARAEAAVDVAALKEARSREYAGVEAELLAELERAFAAAAGETAHVIGAIEDGPRGCTVQGSADTWSARTAWDAVHLA